MKTKIIVCSAVLGFLTAAPVYAGSATTQGNQAPAIVGDNATVNYSISDDNVNTTLEFLTSNSSVPNWALMILVLISFFFIISIITKNTGKDNWRKLEEQLHYLSNQEKEVLKRYIKTGNTTVSLNDASGVVRGLAAKTIIFRATNLGHGFNFDYNIQPWAWKYLNENPHILGLSKAG